MNEKNLSVSECCPNSTPHDRSSCLDTFGEHSNGDESSRSKKFRKFSKIISDEAERTEDRSQFPFLLVENFDLPDNRSTLRHKDEKTLWRERRAPMTPTRRAYITKGYQKKIERASSQNGKQKVYSFKRKFEGAIELMFRLHVSKEESYSLFAECTAVMKKTPLFMPSIDMNNSEAVSSRGRIRYSVTANSTDQFRASQRRFYKRTRQERSKWREIKRCVRVCDKKWMESDSPRVV